MQRVAIFGHVTRNSALLLLLLHVISGCIGLMLYRVPSSRHP
jgi:hypothetical protein